MASLELRRGAKGGAVALAVLGAGLWLGGGASRAFALVRHVAATPGIDPIEGSRVGPARLILLDGAPAKMRRCVAPLGRTVEGVCDHYVSLAAREGDLGEGRSLPCLVSSGDGTACVIWTRASDLRRRGVLVSREAGSVGYALLDGEPAGELAPSGAAPILPGGARAPEGTHLAASLENGESAFAFLEAPGDPVEAAAGLERALAGRGLVLDAEAREALEAARADGAPGRIVLPFHDGERRGLLVVASARPGVSRATVFLR